MYESLLIFFVQENRDSSTICEMTLNDASYEKFKHAIENHYWFQMYMDELPIWGLVGEVMANEGDGMLT